MRIIECKVNQEYIEGSGVVIGAAGSHNDVALRLTFDDMWLGLNIYATFTDATGEHSGVVLLTPSMLVSGEAMTYDLPIPAVAKKIAGKSMLTLSGYSVVNGAEKDRATNTVTAYFRVLKSDYKLLEGSKITPTIEEQIFSEINALGEKVEDTETELVELREEIQDNSDKISGLEDKIEDIGSDLEEKDPTVPDWAKQDTKPSYTAEEVGAADYFWVSALGEKLDNLDYAFNVHKSDFLTQISLLISRLDAVANSDDVDLDQLAEIVAYIKSNKTLIDAITTSKVSVSDIVDNLLTNVSNKPLSARMGVELKRLIESIEVGAGNVTSVNGQTGDVSLGAGDVGAMPAGTKIPEKTSDITNDSGFITKLVSDLANYYTKSQTYTKDEINAKISAIPKFAISVVSSLPTSNISETTVYLVKSGDGGDLYTEYIRVNGAWEILGAQSVDLTGYAKETWVNTQLSAYLKQSELEAAINSALAVAKASGEFDGADGERGTGILNTTTGIASYTTTVNGIKPTYRIALTTLKSQSKVSDVIVGDTVRYSYFLYPIIYVDADYAYMGTRVSIQGGKGDAGKDYVLTEADKAEIAGMSGGVIIPEYWQNELDTKADAIQAAMEKAGRHKSAFLWYTDAHWVNGNSKVSPKLLNYLYMNTPMNKVNFGGDIIGDTLLATREEMKYLYEWRKAIKDLPNHHSVFGNHDMFNLDTVDYEDDNYRYAFLLAPEESYDQVWGNGNYYYIDNPAEKTRYLYICYPNTDTTWLLTQTQFIANSLNSTPEGWHIVAIAHRWWQYSKSSTPTVGSIPSFEKDILSVFDAYNARAKRNGSNYFYAQDFTEGKATVEFCIGGHIHVDYDFFSDGGIPVIITTADTNQNRVPDSTVDSGTVGTTTEAAVYGIIADYNDPNTTKITVVGVGRGTSRVVRPSGIKPTSISNITYSGDTTIGATIDKSKFSFTVNYSNGTTDTVNGATSASPATIGAVGNNSVTITYTEEATTLTATATIVGTPVPVVNLLNLDRTYVAGTAGESIATVLDENKAYTNVAYGNKTFFARSCTASDITENSVTVKESGSGGITVAYPIHLTDIVEQDYKLTFDYSGTGKCRTYWCLAKSDGALTPTKNIYVNDTSGASGSAEVVLDTVNVGVSADTSWKWLIIMLGSNTSGTKTYSNVSLTKA